VRNEPAVQSQRSAALADIINQRGVRTRAKLYQWLRRYGVAECGGITCALLGSFVVRRVTGNAIAAAYGAAWGETIGYSAVIVGRDFLSAARTARSNRRAFGLRGAGGVVAGLLTEFGPAGLLDTLLVRPFAMGVGARLLGPHLGVIAGKLAADVFFYAPVIYMYERTKHWRGQSSGS
jgi:hypothetical protein